MAPIMVNRKLHQIRPFSRGISLEPEAINAPTSTSCGMILRTHVCFTPKPLSGNSRNRFRSCGFRWSPRLKGFTFTVSWKSSQRSPPQSIPTLATFVQYASHRRLSKIRSLQPVRRMSSWQPGQYSSSPTDSSDEVVNSLNEQIPNRIFLCVSE